MGESEPESTGDAVLDLSKTRLRVVGNELQRLNASDGIVMRLPLEEIEHVEFRQRVDPFGVVCGLLAFGVGAIAYFISEYNILTTLLYLAALALGCMALLSVLGQRFVIEAKTGVVDIPCVDPADEGAGFVTSLKRLIGKSSRR